jgi:hypothetical protein
MSNVCATAEPAGLRTGARPLLVILLAVAVYAPPAWAQAQQEPDRASSSSGTQRAATLGLFVAGAAAGLGAHEGGHLLFNAIFDAGAGIKRVDFHGIPFFAITHRAGLPPAKEFTISSAGFWVQHAGNEWLLTRRPRLRHEHAPFAKGMLAFNVLASGAYAGAAFFRTGPAERDTHGMAVSADVDERWIGAIVLAPAVFDVWRYFDPDARAAIWLSRAVKIGGVLLIVRAAAR